MQNFKPQMQHPDPGRILARHYRATGLHAAISEQPPVRTVKVIVPLFCHGCGVLSTPECFSQVSAVCCSTLSLLEVVEKRDLAFRRFHTTPRDFVRLSHGSRHPRNGESKGWEQLSSIVSRAGRLPSEC